MRTRDLSVTGLWLAALISISAVAFADTTEEMEAETKRLNAEKALAAARYGAPIEGKTGDVTGAGSLSGIAQQHAFLLSKRTAASLADSLRNKFGSLTCKDVIVTENVDLTSKMLKAETLVGKIEDLETRMAAVKVFNRQTQSVTAAVAVVAGLLGSANQIAGMFRSDYAVADVNVTFENSWIVGAVLTSPSTCSNKAGCSELRSDLYPNMQRLRDWYTRLDDMRKKAEAIEEKVQADTAGKTDDASKKANADAKKLVDSVAALITALIEPAASGVAPIASFATFVDPAPAQKGVPKANVCLARLIVGSAKGTVITKNGIFGKGGKVYAQMPLQLAAVVTDMNGQPLGLVCKQTSYAAAINVSDMTKSTGGKTYQDAAWQQPAQTMSTAEHCNGEEIK